MPLALWDCTELARRLVTDGVVSAISPETVRRVLASHQLKPWRVHHWLSAKVPRDAAFVTAVSQLCALYSDPLPAHELVLCVDEKTSLQPRHRTAPTRPARRGQPVRLEHEYVRGGALHLFAAFDTRTGRVIGWNATRKRAVEFISFLDLLEASVPPTTTRVHVVLDNLSVHKSAAVQTWLAAHPRVRFHFPPVHCSWMNQVEEWLSILERKALRAVNFPGTLALDRHLHGYLAHWNEHAHPFNWTTRSVTKVLAKCDPALAPSAAA